MQVQNKVFVVTGAGNGIGREVTLELLRRGASVAGVDVSAAGLDETRNLANTDATKFTVHPLDLTDRDAVEVLPDAVVAAHGQVDGLLNVAGIIQRFVPFAELTHDDVAKVMNVNFWGVINTTAAFLPLLTDRPEAALVNVSSMGALVPVPGQAIYGASKAAVKLFTEGLQAELRSSPVTVTVVFPGAIGTDIAANSGVSMGDRDAESSSFKMTAPAEAGRQIVEAVVNGDPRLRIGGDAKMLDRISRLMPTRAIDMIAKRMEALVS